MDLFMDYSWRNLNNIYQHVLKLGMLSPPEDVIACWLAFGSHHKIKNFLELGSYIGGGLGVFNETLNQTGHKGVEFIGVDHLDFIGAKSQGNSGAWYTDHFSRCLSISEITELQQLTSADSAASWISDRCQRFTGHALKLKCVISERDIPNIKYDVIHHDYGDSVEENLSTIKYCIPMLDEHGIYIVDDWCTGAPLRTWATVIAQQERLLFPAMWGKNKVFFAKSAESAQHLVRAILANPECNQRLFKVMPGSNYFGSDYQTIRMHWQAMQWS
jgi:hypothetical protein